MSYHIRSHKKSHLMAPHCSLEERFDIVVLLCKKEGKAIGYSLKALSVLREASRSLLITRGFDHVKGKEIDDLC